MVFTSFRACSILILFVVCVAPAANARAKRHWSEKELFRASDLVVLAEAESSQASQDKFPRGVSWEEAETKGFVTFFKVKLVLKGSEPTEEIRVLHFRFLSLRRGIINGPNFVHFATQPVDLSFNDQRTSAKPRYLLFLKKMADGRYEPVSGQIDPDDSVRILLNGNLSG
jgi:hypothetical protein